LTGTLAARSRYYTGCHSAPSISGNPKEREGRRQEYGPCGLGLSKRTWASALYVAHYTWRTIHGSSLMGSASPRHLGSDKWRRRSLFLYLD
jgi:hypothetical protein